MLHVADPPAKLMPIRSDVISINRLIVKFAFYFAANPFLKVSKSKHNYLVRNFKKYLSFEICKHFLKILNNYDFFFFKRDFSPVILEKTICFSLIKLNRTNEKTEESLTKAETTLKSKRTTFCRITITRSAPIRE